DLLKMMPGMGGQLDAMQMDGNELKRMEAIILSMTPAERTDPTVLEASRRRRIARGSGCDPQDVSGMVKQFTQASHMMKQMAGMKGKDRAAFAQQMAQMGAAGGNMQYKKKQRSKRLTKKERAKKKKGRR
ncbi:MAG: signal recognition particle protein, partial [Planctomycetota bacterium]